MKKVILRFLRNKAIEIGKGLLYLVITVVAIFLCLSGVYLFEDYVIGDMCLSDENILFKIFAWISLLFTGIVMLAMLYSILNAIVDWLKENWERAKEETGYES